MVETRIWRAAPICAADDPAVGARRGETRARSWRPRLWALLNAQALIRGAAGGPDDIALVEDDRQRLARRGVEPPSTPRRGASSAST
jgi:hypothetical protein